MRQHACADERGLTHILVAAGAVIVVLVVGLATWMVIGGQKAGSKDNSNGTKTTNTIYASCMTNYHDSRLCKFASQYTPLAKTAYQATVVVTSPQGTVSNLTYSSDGGGNSEVTGTSDGQQLSSIQLRGADYIRVTGSGWIEYPAGATNTPAQTDPTANLNIAVGQSNLSFQYLGTQACGSMTCYKYQVVDRTQPTATQDMWFDTTSYKLRQWTYHGSTGSTSMTISYQPITIAAPSPVKVI